MIGTLGDLKFVTSSNQMKTFKDLSVSQSVRYGEHETLQGKPKLEYTGQVLDSLKFQLYWRVEDRVNPEREIDYLYKKMAEGEVLSFILGGVKVGSGRYVITNIERSFVRFDNRGKALAVKYDISLKEYIEEKKVSEVANNNSKKSSNVVKKENIIKTGTALTAIATKNPLLAPLVLPTVGMAAIYPTVKRIINKG